MHVCRKEEITAFPGDTIGQPIEWNHLHCRYVSQLGHIIIRGGRMNTRGGHVIRSRDHQERSRDQQEVA